MTHHNALDMPLYLRIADELYLKRLIVGGLERVYEIGHDFRNEGMDRTHNPEFTMLELYQAYADYGDMMDTGGGAVRRSGPEQSAAGPLHLERGGACSTSRRPSSGSRFVDGIRQASGVDVLTRLGGRDAGAAGAGRASAATRWQAFTGGKLLDEMFKRFLEPHLVQPTFVVDYPKADLAAGQGAPGRPAAHRAVRAVRPGQGAGQRVQRAQRSRTISGARFEDQVRQRAAGNEEAQPYDADYIRALEYGMPPTGGMGIGVDRVVMLLTDQPSIRDVILFPAMRPED